MNKQRQSLARRYAVTVERYLKDQQEAVLEQAYDLGRWAAARRFGVLEMARVHQQAAAPLLASVARPAERRQASKAAETFFLEALSPFEVTHRGFRETNRKLQQLIATLQKRNLDLAETNRELGREIAERERTEKALRVSEQHLRELFNQARHMEESLRSLSNQILHVQEEERKNISRELHDEVGQTLTAISMNLHALKRNGTVNPELAQRKLTDTEHLLQQTMEIVHRFARELRPTMLDELGLLPALRSYLKGFADRTGLRIHFRANLLAEYLDGEQKTVVFRVAQESLTNVAKHAQASRVALTIRKIKNGICMEVADNGRSFQENPKRSAQGKKRLGLLGMQERVRLVAGQFAVKPDPGRGTTVRIILPFKAASAAALSARGRSSRTPLNLSPRRDPFHRMETATPPRNRYGKNQGSIG